MPDLTPQQHSRRYNELETQAAQWRTLWEELQNYVAPWRDPVQTAKHSGQKQTDKIFDSTASHVVNISSAAVHGMTMPAGTKWFTATHPIRQIAEQVEVGQWLEGVTTTITDAFLSSNLAQESQEFITDLLVFGTACLYMEAKAPSASRPTPSLRFRAMPPGSYVIAENADGLVDTVYRKFKLSVDAIVRRWGPEKSGPAVKKLWDEGKLDTKMNILHATMPRDARDVREGDDISVPKKNRPFMSEWIVLGQSSAVTAGGAPGTQVGGGLASEKELHVLESDGLFEFPFLVARWRKMSGEDYGRSPGIDALPDIRTLNQAVEYRLKAWTLAIAPPIATSDRGVIGDVRLVPFGRTHVRGNPRDSIMPIDIGANFNVANFSEEQLRDQIRRAFFIDQLQRAESQGKSPKSATEVSISFELMMRILGPVASRLQTEFLAPLIKNAYRLIRRGNGFTPAPEALLAEGTGIDVEYQGPLARAQSIQEVDAVNRWLQVALPLAELRPEILAWVDFSELGKSLADAVSVPREVMKSRKQVEAETQQAQEEAAAQAQQADLLAAGEVINKVTPAVLGRQGQG